MNDELKAACAWCVWDGGDRFRLALNVAAMAPALPGWLRENYRIVKVERLRSGAIGVCLRSSAKGNGLLYSLPKPKWGGSFHECNDLSWP